MQSQRNCGVVKDPSVHLPLREIWDLVCLLMDGNRDVKGLMIYATHVDEPMSGTPGALVGAAPCRLHRILGISLNWRRRSRDCRLHSRSGAHGNAVMIEY